MRQEGLSNQEKILAESAYLGDDKEIITYEIRGDLRVLYSKVDWSSEETFRKIAEKFREDPKAFLANCRWMLFHIMRDPKMLAAEKKDRLSRYLDAYFDLTVKLDRAAFPPSDKVKHSVPSYLPDGLSDLGSDFQLEAGRRTREKPRVVKSQDLKAAKYLFMQIFSDERLGSLDYGSTEIKKYIVKGVARIMQIFSNKRLASLDYGSTEIKEYIVQCVARHVQSQMPCDFKSYGGAYGGVSKPLDAFRDNGDDPKAVCRHHALYTQVLNQAFGITSRLLKCNLNGCPHGANLVRIQNQWYLLDSTNPIYKKGKPAVCLVPIPEKEIDLNRYIYTWTIKYRDQNNVEQCRVYTSRNDMYFRIRDNEHDPVY